MVEVGPKTVEMEVKEAENSAFQEVRHQRQGSRYSSSLRCHYFHQLGHRGLGFDLWPHLRNARCPRVVSDLGVS